VDRRREVVKIGQRYGIHRLAAIDESGPARDRQCVDFGLALARRRQASELPLEQQWLVLLELRDFTARQHAAFPRMARG